MTGLRILVAFACGVDLCLTGMLFQQVGRFFIPRWQMRGLMGTSMIVTAAIGLANLQHVHRSPTWSTWAIAVGTVGQAAFLAWLFQWYGSTEGRRHVAAMLESKQAGQVAARTSVERRVDQLLVGVIAVFGIAMFTLLVIGASAYRTNQEQERTRSALCTYRGDLADRSAQAQASLATSTAYVFARYTSGPLRGQLKRPGRIYGFPRSVIVAGLKTQQAAVHNQQRALRSLAGLHC